MTESPPIVHLVQSIHMTAGIEVLVFNLTERYGAQAHIASIDGTMEELCAQRECSPELQSRIHFLHKAPGFDWGCVRRMARLLRELGAKALYTHHIGPLLYGGLAKKFTRGVRHVHVEHDAWHLEASKNRRFQRVMLAIARPTVIADCGLVASSLQRHFPRLKPVTIPNGVDVEVFVPGDPEKARKVMGLPLGVKIVGCAGRLERVKGQHDLLSAMPFLPDDVHLALAGAGSCREALEAQAHDLGIVERTHFLGLVSDMRTFYQAIDVFGMASSAEGLPLAPLEAQACGVTAVLTDVGGCPEAVCPTTGLLSPVHEPEALAAALTKALERRASPDTPSPRDFVVAERNFAKLAEAYNEVAGIEVVGP